MRPRVRWSLRAVQRAAAIALEMAEADPAAAERWVRGLFYAVRLLGRFPRRGRVVPELSRPEVRELIYRDHRVVYRVSERLVEILTVRHARRLLDVGEGEPNGRR